MGHKSDNKLELFKGNKKSCAWDITDLCAPFYAYFAHFMFITSTMLLTNYLKYSYEHNAICEKSNHADKMIGWLSLKNTAGKDDLYHYFFWKSAFEPRRNVARVFEVKSKFSKPINEIVHIRDIIPFSPHISDMFCYHGINFLSDLFGKEKRLDPALLSFYDWQNGFILIG